MPADYAQIARDIYALFHSLPRHNYNTPRDRLPPNAVYGYFQRGERIPWDTTVIHRSVRVGSYQKNGILSQRICQHYGRVNSFKGDGVLRKHLWLLSGSLTREQLSGCVADVGRPGLGPPVNARTGFNGT